MRKLFLLSLIPFLTACQTESTPTETITPPQTGTCSADRLQHLVGTRVQDFDFEALGEPVRIIPPGTAVTMDHREERLNVSTDADGIIDVIRCG